MKVSDLRPNQIRVGLKLRSLINSANIGTITSIDKDRDNLAWITWSGSQAPTSAFFGNECECEVIEASLR